MGIKKLVYSNPDGQIFLCDGRATSKTTLLVYSSEIRDSDVAPETPYWFAPSWYR
jgi:hypothetical protein